MTLPFISNHLSCQSVLDKFLCIEKVSIDVTISSSSTSMEIVVRNAQGVSNFNVKILNIRISCLSMTDVSKENSLLLHE